jgi:ankyrin repeat protein
MWKGHTERRHFQYTELSDNSRIPDTELCLAITRRSTQKIRALLDSGVDVNQFSGPEHCSALQLATTYGLVDIMKSLLERGASVDIRTSIGLTPLFFAVQSGLVDAARILLEHKADVSAHSNKGSMPLHTAVRAASYTTPIENKNATVSLLLAFGADANACETGDNKTALMEAVKCKDNPELVQMLLRAMKSHSAIDAIDCTGNTALHYAIDAENLQAVKLLLLDGALLTLVDSDKRTPLQLAKYKSDCEANTQRVVAARGHATKINNVPGDIAKFLTDVADRARNKIHTSAVGF